MPVALSAPTMAGMPSSRATMAAWQVRPPRSVTMAAAFFITGSQSGLVVSATSTSPGWKAARSRVLGDDAHGAAGDLLADGAAGRRTGGAALERIGFEMPARAGGTPRSRAAPARCRARRRARPWPIRCPWARHARRGGSSGPRCGSRSRRASARRRRRCRSARGRRSASRHWRVSGRPRPRHRPCAAACGPASGAARRGGRARKVGLWT